MFQRKMNKKLCIASNLFWKFSERIGAQVVTLIVSMVLARLLEPEMYGTIALATVLISILNVFIDSGLGLSLIQKEKADDIDFSSVFFFNCLVCLILYFSLFTCAPFIASFYKRNELCLVIRVLGLSLIISGIKNIQQAYISKHMMFKKFFLATLGGTISAAIAGIWLAFYGYGIWALVIPDLLNKSFGAFTLWITVAWRPQFVFSWCRLKKLLSFGWKILLASILNTIYNDLRQLFVGKEYSTETLAFFNKGEQLPSLLIININSSIDNVLFSAMSAEQNDKVKLKKMTRMSIKICFYILAPIMIGFAISAKTIICLLFTEKWLPCVPIMQILCIAYLFQPIQSANLNVIKGLGQSGLFLKLEVFKKVLGVIMLLISMRWGIISLALSVLFHSILCIFITSWPNTKLIKYTLLEQIIDILPSLCLAFVMGCIIHSVQLLNLANSLLLFLQIIIGITVYVILSILFDFT